MNRITDSGVEYVVMSISSVTTEQIAVLSAARSELSPSFKSLALMLEQILAICEESMLGSTTAPKACKVKH
jgi:hypothetical protein